MIIIKSKKDIKKVLELLKENEGEAVIFTVGKYYRYGYGTHHKYYVEDGKIMYNYRGNNGSRLLYDIEISEEKFYRDLWEYRKFFNYETIEKEKERERGEYTDKYGNIKFNQ